MTTCQLGKRSGRKNTITAWAIGKHKNAFFDDWAQLNKILVYTGGHALPETFHSKDKAETMIADGMDFNEFPVKLRVTIEIADATAGAKGKS